MLSFLGNGPASQTDIAMRVGMTTGGTTAMIDRLERHNLVTRGDDPHDRRRNIVTLTDRAKAMFADSMAQASPDGTIVPVLVDAVPQYLRSVTEKPAPWRFGSAGSGRRIRVSSSHRRR